MPHPPTDPRSPVQPGGKFPVKPLLLALVAAASIWTWQQSRDEGDRPEPRRDRPAPQAVPEGPVPQQPISPPPPDPTIPAPATRARANLASLFSTDDYPMAAIRNEEQGMVQFRITVAPDGRVSDCTIIASSGSAALDRASCSIVARRARFEPARDASGQPVGDSMTSRVRWELPQD